MAQETGDSAASIARAYPAMSSYADEIVRVSKVIGIHPSWLANVINFESGGNPQARNRLSDASGLIQFMPFTAKPYGLTVEQIRAMSGREQMKLVERYFSRKAGKLKSQEDVYMMVFYPAAIGNPDFQFPASVTKYNPGIYTPRDYVKMANRRAKLATYVGQVAAEVVTRAEAAAGAAEKATGVPWPMIVVSLGLALMAVTGAFAKKVA